MSQPNTPFQRLLSLDAFRGATIALMVLVNDPGDGKFVYGPLNHAEWHGWTLTDTVFPSFLWIVGVAMTIVLARRAEQGVSKSALFRHALRRSAILYGLGLFLYMFPKFDFATMRVLGVLQRIAICYLIASAICLTSSIRAQIAWIIGLLSSYWLIMAFAPVPGIGAGFLDVERNFAHYVDQIVLGRHNYVWTVTWDPEGIVSTLPAIATALLGVMAGHILRLPRTLAERTTWLFFIGNLLIAAGLFCDLWLPINKKLWTTSFALFMAGLDFVVFAGFLWLIDGAGWKKFVKPFAILGGNAIAVYVASELLAETMNSIRWTAPGGVTNLQRWVYQTLFLPLASPINASLRYALAYTGLMWLFAWFLYRRGWFLKV